LALSRRRRRITHTLQLNSTQYTPGRLDQSLMLSHAYALTHRRGRARARARGSEGARCWEGWPSRATAARRGCRVPSMCGRGSICRAANPAPARAGDDRRSGGRSDPPEICTAAAHTRRASSWVSDACTRAWIRRSRSRSHGNIGGSGRRRGFGTRSADSA
jgi:hypothetical protein